MEIITIAAIVFAPLLAFSTQWVLQFFREKRERKIWIFRTLMSTRLSILSPEHVKALNLIDLEFNSSRKKDKSVREAWHTYLDQLNVPIDPSTHDRWNEKSAELRNQLLHRISDRLRFGFQLSEIRKNCYAPDYYGRTEAELLLIRHGLLELLAGRKSLAMDVRSFPSDEIFAEAQKKQIDLSIEYLQGKRSLPITIVENKQSEHSLVDKSLRESFMPPPLRGSAKEGDNK